MKKILLIMPHTSTGGAPACSLKKIELLKDSFNIKVIEYANIAPMYNVQRNRIINLVGALNFCSLGDDKRTELIEIIEVWKPDRILMEEFPCFFMDDSISDYIYRKDRPYTIFESTHDSSFNPKHKRYFPDKFIFVCPYNAFKYVHLNIPYEIIEYPVDKRIQNKEEARKKLGLEADYKHVVIVGLFTQRKNQKYAFEICNLLSEYKIKFHFIGNMAGNFQSYWQPILDWKATNPKLDNCVIWGERSDTDDFYKAADLFLFPSKGERSNKELNPITIKESLEYTTLPKLMYNLDVYLNRFNNIDNMHFLDGDVAVDANKVLELTKPSKYENLEELIIIGTYPNLKSRAQLTKDTIQSMKVLGRKIMLVSHYPVDAETQAMVDYYIYDKHNPLTHHSYYTLFYRHTNEYHADININGLKNSNQSLTVLTNLFNGAKTAKQHGFSRFFYSTFDVILHEDDVNEVDSGFSFINDAHENHALAYLGTLNTPFGKGIQTNGMFFDIDFFLDNYSASTLDGWGGLNTPEAYNTECEKIGSQNFLEDYLMKKTQRAIAQYSENVILRDTPEETLLRRSGLGTSSNSEYYSIIKIDKQPGHYMLYFYSYNVDDRIVCVKMKTNGAEFYQYRFLISKTNEFKKEFEYTGEPIEVILEFYDGETIYKTENYVLNSQTIDKYNDTGLFKWVNKKPKIKLVHLQTTLNDEREQKSWEDLRRLSDYGIEYIRHTNAPYTSLPPTHNCMRPDCVSMELFTEEQLKLNGGQTAITPAHRGCYESFMNAALSEFHDCDFFIMAEGDCKITKPIEEFVNAIYEAARLCEENNIGYFSFGDKATLEHGWLQSTVVREIPNQNLMYITSHIIGIQFIMFPKFVANYLKYSFLNKKYDAADIYFNTIFKTSEYAMGIVHERMTSQYDGKSLIDNQYKKFL